MKTNNFIYLIRSSDNTYKIGVSKNPQKRLKNLQTGNANKLELVDRFECEQSFKVEKALHRRYKIEKTESGNEWLHLKQEQVNNFISDCEIICENLSYVFKHNPFLNDKI